MLLAPSTTPLLDNPLENLHDVVRKFLDASVEGVESASREAPRQANKEIAKYTKVETLSGCSQVWMCWQAAPLMLLSLGLFSNSGEAGG